MGGRRAGEGDLEGESVYYPDDSTIPQAARGLYYILHVAENRIAYLHDSASRAAARTAVRTTTSRRILSRRYAT